VKLAKSRSSDPGECPAGIFSSRESATPCCTTPCEQGLPSCEAVLRYGLVAPTGTPRPTIERLNKELHAVLASDDIRARFATVQSRAALINLGKGSRLSANHAALSETANIPAE
jgi:hypothetical protein